MSTAERVVIGIWIVILGTIAYGWSITNSHVPVTPEVIERTR